jgi:N-acyl homoserine lactone hydrolase
VIRVYAFHCGGDQADLAITDPLDRNVGTRVYTPFFFYLVEHPRGRVLFDSGVHPAAREDPRGYLGAVVDGIDLELAPDDDVPGQLRRLQLTPADVDVLVQSHLHFDHAGGVSLLPGVPVYLQAKELEFARNPPIYQRALYVPADFEHEDIDWRLIDGDHDLFGDGTVQILATPGHTAGHQSLLVKGTEGTVILLSDATYSVEKMRQRRIPALVWSPDAMVESWERLERLEQEYDAQVVCSHELRFRELVPLAPNTLI